MKTDLQINNPVSFEEVVVSLENSLFRLRDIFENQNKNKDSINETDSWSGKAQAALSKKYEQLSQNFAPIDYSIELYIKFLRKTLEDYKLADAAISKNLEEMTSSLDVNS